MPSFRSRLCSRACLIAPPLAPARSRAHRRSDRAISVTEAVVAVAVVLLMASLTAAVIARAQRARGTTVCAANLRAIGMAFENYAIDNRGRLPATLKTNNQWEDLLRKYLHRSIFQCPSDSELFTSLGSSYDWRDTGDPLTTLSGKSLTEPVRTNIALAFEALPGWHEPCRVQVVFLDGSVRMESQEALLLDLTTPIRSQP